MSSPESAWVWWLPALGVSPSMFLAAADALVREVSEEDLEVDRIYPPLSRIRKVSVNIATA